MKKIIIILLIAFACKVNPILIQNNIEGKWINLDDSKSKLLVTKNEIIEIYAKDTLNAYQYEISSKSCDENYIVENSDNLLFFKQFNDFDEIYCFEILAIEPNLFNYRYTVNGKIFRFKREK